MARRLLRRKLQKPVPTTSFHESSNSTIHFKIVIRRISLGRNPIDPAKVHRKFFNGHSKVACFHSRSRFPLETLVKRKFRELAPSSPSIGSDRSGTITVANSPDCLSNRYRDLIEIIIWRYRYRKIMISCKINHFIPFISYFCFEEHVVRIDTLPLTRFFIWKKK